MPRYFFDIHDIAEALDTEGQELPDVTAARAQAMQIAAAYAGRPIPDGEDGGAIVVAVREGQGDIILRVRLVFTVTTG